MNRGSVVKFGVQVGKRFVFGASTSVGVMTPFYIAGVMVKRSVKKKVEKTGDKVFSTVDTFFTNEQVADAGRDLIETGLGRLMGLSDERRDRIRFENRAFDLKTQFEKTWALHERNYTAEQIAEELGIDKDKVELFLASPKTPEEKD